MAVTGASFIFIFIRYSFELGLTQFTLTQPNLAQTKQKQDRYLSPMLTH
ncbi:MAG: hypothetical protein ACJA2Q_002607 [Pseudohongiellaceae bacterium]|jgi:hypothetical protein